MMIRNLLLNKRIIVLSIILFAGLISCKKDDSNNPSAAAVLTTGSWKVTYYYDKIKDETSDYAGYVFVFQQNNQLNITSSSGNANGSWSISNSDDNGGSQKLNLFAGSNDPLNSLNDDWVITAISNSKIELKDDSNNNEVLHFTKL